MDESYTSKLFYKLAMIFVIVGAVNWGLVGGFKINLVERVLGKNTVLTRGIYILVGLSALAIAFNRDTYLPFLGESVFPCSVLPDQIPAGATRSVQINAEPGSKVVYWASEPSDNDGELKDYKDAYRQYQNAGVATADSAGVAVLKVREPQSYAVPFKGQLEPHVHFRICGPTGFVGRIKTVYLADGRIEGFVGH